MPYLDFIIVADTRQPETLQHIDLICERKDGGGGKGGQKVEKLKEIEKYVREKQVCELIKKERAR